MQRMLKLSSVLSAVLIIWFGGLTTDVRDILFVRQGIPQGIAGEEKRGKYEDHLVSLFRELAYSDFNGFDSPSGNPPSPREERPEGPEFAGFRDYLMCMDPEIKRIPEKAWLKAADYIRKEFSLGNLKSGEAFEWEEIQSNTGGRTRAVMYDPNDPDQSKVWAGGVTGGLWYIEDIHGEDNWLAVDDFWPGLAVSCMTYDPNDPGVFYVGTGEGQTAVVIYRESSGRGSGIWKSTNGGEDWELLASTEGFEYVTDIEVRNESGKSVVYAAVASGFYKGEIHSSQPEEGLFRSEDGGNNWEQVLPDIPGENIPYSPSQIEITASGRMFVGTMRNIYQKGGGCILYSENGYEWIVQNLFAKLIEQRETNNIPGRVILASAPSNANRMYAILSGGQTDPRSGFIYSRGVMIIKSQDGGISWQQVKMPVPHEGEEEGQWSFLAWHALTAAVQPDDPDVVWIGGLDLYRSDDGGWSWHQKSLWWNFGDWFEPDYPIYVHADQHNLIYKPGSSSELLNSNDGGVFLATDSRNPAPQFMEKNQGYNTLQYYTCAIHPEAGERYFLGGCQDNGTFRTTNEPTSKDVSVSYGDGAYCFIDEDEPNIQISSSQFNFFYVSTDGKHDHTYDYNVDGGTFINPVDYDDADNILYANAMSFEGVFRDEIFRISLLHDTVISPMHIPARTGSRVPFSAIHVVPEKEGGKTCVLAGSQSGRLFRLDNAQAVISSTNIGSPDFPAGYISCIQTGESKDRILVTFSNYGVEHVWETLDGGSTWKDKTGNLPDMPVRWAIYPPGTNGTVMLATELGIWYTLDIGDDPVEWVQAGQFPNVRVDMLSSRESDGQILAATHGRGLFLGSGSALLNDHGTVSPEGNMRVYPNPASDYINIEIPDGPEGVWTLELFNSDGKGIRKMQQRGRGKGNVFRMPLEGLVPGIYLIKAETKKQHYSQTIIKK